MTNPSGGGQLADALRSGSPRDVLTAEADLGHTERFAAIEQLTAQLFAGALSGHNLAEITHKNRGGRAAAVRLVGLDSNNRSFLDQHFDLAAQESRGAWYLPQEASLRAGTANLAAYVLAGNPFAINAARDGNVKVSLRDAPDALAMCALVLPAMETLLAPIEQRSATGKPKPAERQRKAWQSIADTYASLEIDLGDPLSRMTYGSGWTKLRIAEKRELTGLLVAHLAGSVTSETARLWRARSTQQLAQAYFKKAKAGPPLARSVLTNALQPAFSTVFGGDWLAFLDYLGSEPNPAEQITTTLPEPRLYVSAHSKVAEVAADQGIPIDEVEHILASFLGQNPGTSPVQERVDTMRRWWSKYDAIWSRQSPGMPSLWGLVDEGLFVLDNPQAPVPYLYRQLLTPELSATIDRLWDGVTLPRWPERIVSEFHPHRQMAEAFGPAVAFWQGVALTCWYVCEGPSSRTTLGALSRYHSREINALRDAGFPIDPAFLTELAQAENRLGSPQNLETRRNLPTVGAFEMTVTVSAGTGRDGFEILRDIVTRHRRAWAATHLDRYLEHRWDTELREVAREHSRRVAAKGKPPTIKQFASFAAAAANHWFGGDLAALYAALGEVAPAAPERIDLLAGDPHTFVRAVWTALGGRYLPEDASWKDRPAFDHQWQIGKLASHSLHYLQLAEALGRPPTPKEFGANRITWDSFRGEEQGWQRYCAVIEAARSQPTPVPPPPPAPQAPPSQTPLGGAPPPPPAANQPGSGWRRFLGRG